MNSKWHAYTSFIKSGIRILAVVLAIVFLDWFILAIGLGLAEILGIVEEVKDER